MIVLMLVAAIAVLVLPAGWAAAVIASIVAWAVMGAR